MSKTLIVAMALSLVLVSGGLFSAQADCNLCGWHLTSPCSWHLSPCNWHFPSFCGHCAANDAAKTDADRAAVSNDKNMDKGSY